MLFYLLGSMRRCRFPFGSRPGPLGFWLACCSPPRGRGNSAPVIEMLVLRRSTGAPELYQLLATFALVLVIRTCALWCGPESAGPKAPGLSGAVTLLVDASLPTTVLVVRRPLGLRRALAALTHALGAVVRAATQDREMVARSASTTVCLFTRVRARTFLAASARIQMPHEPANLTSTSR